LHVRLLGGFGVSVGSRLVDEGSWRLRKAKSLVKLLALAPGHRIHRERVVELLWPDRDPASAANNLHQVLYAARRALAAAGQSTEGLLELRDDLVLLGPAEGVDTDVECFETLADRARDTGTPEDIRTAIEAYAGELLPEDRYEDWTAARRGALRERYLHLLVALADAHMDRQQIDLAIERLRQVLSEDELYEPAHRALMRSYATAGRRQDALHQYARLRDALRAEYDADPDPETRRLYRELLSGSLAGAPDERAQEPSAGPRRHNLPVQLTSFVGRERELGEIGRLLSRIRLLTLTGPGGSGKTRLAREVAARRVDAYPDGVWLVELAALGEPSLLADAVAAALGLQPPAGGPPTRAITAQLADRRLLLVLDNCEHLIDASSRLVTALLRACPGLVVLVTSREPLHVPGEATWRVPSLTLPERGGPMDPAALEKRASVRLFVERARDVQPEFALDEANAGAVVEICLRLDGMPLAIELAAARTRLLTPQQIAARLGDALAVLGGGSRTGLTRHQTLRAALAWSHDLLADDERTLFRRLAVFVGSFPLEAVEGVCAAPPVDHAAVLDVLARLVDKSLVVVERHGGIARYRLLETIRQFARQLLAEAGEADEIERRHCLWFLDVAGTHDPERATGVVNERPQLLDVEHDNLRAALGWAVTHDPEVALELASSLWRFWLARGHFAEGRRWLDAALAVATESTDKRVRALHALLTLDVRLGIQSRIEPMSAEAVTISRRLDDPAGLALSLHLRGLMTWMRYDFQAAAAHAEEALAIARQHGVRTAEPAATQVLALVALAREQPDQARSRLTEILVLLDGLADASRPFFPAVTPGFLTENLPDGRMVILFEETKLLGRRVGTAQAVAYVRSLLGGVERIDGDLDEALARAGESARRFASLGDAAGEALALNHVGCVHRLRGEFDEGRRCLDRSLRLRTDLGDRRGIALTLGNLGLLEAAAGDLEAGRARLATALEMCEATEDGPGTSGTLLKLGIVAIRAGDARTARTLLEQSRDGFLTQEILGPTAWITAMLADVAVDDGDDARADALWDQAESQFRELGMNRALAYCARRRGTRAAAQPPLSRR
jgi:predicted ATPase/DNA-binding SARP family transcriptional activator